MITRRPSDERGFQDKGWLQTYHTFSFDTYYDPDFLGYHQLRVINEDRLKGGKGFGTHFHKEMEILTYVIDGVLEHKDSMGNTSLIRPGEIQRMSAGTGVNHSEYNLSHHLPVHFLQMWINPVQHGLDPSYDQRTFSSASKWGRWCLLASQNGRDGSVRVHQDVDLFTTLLEATDELTFETFPERHYWIQVISGRFLIQETPLQAGDGAAIEDEVPLEVRCLEAGELLLFDLA